MPETRQKRYRNTHRAEYNTYQRNYMKRTGRNIKKFPNDLSDLKDND